MLTTVNNYDWNLNNSHVHVKRIMEIITDDNRTQKHT